MHVDILILYQPSSGDKTEYAVDREVDASRGIDDGKEIGVRDDIFLTNVSDQPGKEERDTVLTRLRP